MFPTPLLSLIAALGFGGPSTNQTAQLSTAPFAKRPAVTAPAPAPKTVSPPVAREAATGSVKGTVVLVHGGGWEGPDSAEQDRLLDEPGAVIEARGWRIVSVDYRAGLDGFNSLVDEIGQQLIQPAGGLLCVYGESSGAQLALIAAARMPGIDCVIAAGPPTDFATFRTEAQAIGGMPWGVYSGLIEPTFGEPGPATAAWEPAKVANRINADVLLLRQADDHAIPAGQADAFVSALPTTQLVDLPAGDFSDESQRWLHGSLSPAGRDEMHAAIAGLLAREETQRRVTRAALRTGCRRATQALDRVGVSGLRGALRCLARARPVSVPPRMASESRAARTAVRGQVTAARVWDALRGSPRGRGALARIAAGRKVHISVRLGASSRVVVG